VSCGAHSPRIQNGQYRHRFFSNEGDEMYPGEKSKAAHDETVTVGGFRDDTKFADGLDQRIDHSKHVFFDEPLWPGGPGEVPDPQDLPKAPALDNDALPEWVRAFDLAAQLEFQEVLEEKEKRKASGQVAVQRVKTVDEKGRAYGTGRRKASVARVWIVPRSASAIDSAADSQTARRVFNPKTVSEGMASDIFTDPDIGMADIIREVNSWPREAGDDSEESWDDSEEEVALTPEEQLEVNQMMEELGLISTVFSEISFTVNKRNVDEYFLDRAYHLNDICAPFHVTGTLGEFDIFATAKGGGKSGQAGALRLGISRALQNYNPAFRPALKAAGLLTRDARVVERKKPGQAKARKKFQWVKR